MSRMTDICHVPDEANRCARPGMEGQPRGRSAGCERSGGRRGPAGCERSAAQEVSRVREVGWAQVVGWVPAVERLRATGRGRPGADGRAQRICRLRARERRRLICRKRASTDGLGDSGWFGRMRMVGRSRIAGTGERVMRMRHVALSCILLNNVI